jgi:hypothetical protein
MIRTNEMEVVPCDECDGTGEQDKHIECPICDHSHETVVKCEWCDGEGVRAYFKTVYDPSCRYCVLHMEHPISFSLPVIQAARGPIKFFDPTT